MGPNSSLKCLSAVILSVLVFLSPLAAMPTVSQNSVWLEGLWSTQFAYDLDGGSAWRPDLVVDSHGTVHGTFISFPYTTGAEVRQLTFLRFSGDTLIMGSVEGTTGVSSHSIAVDQDDCLHMLATVPGEVRYFTGNQDAWSFVTVEGVSSDYCSILVDSEGTVHALYYDTTNVMLKHATLIGGSWSIEALDELHSVDSATLDSDGCVHGCYCSDEGALVYFSNSSGAWESETIDANCIVQMWSASVAVLDGGTRTITYCDELNDNLKMARPGDGQRDLSGSFRCGLSPWRLASPMLQPRLAATTSSTPAMSWNTCRQAAGGASVCEQRRRQLGRDHGPAFGSLEGHGELQSRLRRSGEPAVSFSEPGSYDVDYICMTDGRWTDAERIAKSTLASECTLCFDSEDSPIRGTTHRTTG